MEPDGSVLEGHAVVARGDRITAVLPVREAHGRHPSARRVVLPTHALVPGLINLHTHAAMALLRGIADDLPLKAWLTEHIWPAEARHVSPEFVEAGTLVAAAEMLRSGTPASTTCTSRKPPPGPPRVAGSAPCWASWCWSS
jgi:5-methylthioadenosine/S-adenosylhomocysteine deaminase